jgi:hypothetical protein
MTSLPLIVRLALLGAVTLSHAAAENAVSGSAASGTVIYSGIASAPPSAKTGKLEPIGTAFWCCFCLPDQRSSLVAP